MDDLISLKDLETALQESLNKTPRPVRRALQPTFEAVLKAAALLPRYSSDQEHIPLNTDPSL